MKPIEWLAEDEIRCRDIRLKLCEDLSPAKPIGDEQVTLFKSRKMLEEMVSTLQGMNVRRMLDLGIWDGGSAIFFEHHLQPERLVGVDIGRQFPFLERYIGRHQLEQRMRVYSNTSQDDEAALENIFRKDFEGADLDLIIDDASHFLEQTRRSFEICFPRLRAGGLYIIEDWSWGHYSAYGKNALPGQMPPSPLLFELLLICGTPSDIIRRVVVNPDFLVIERGEKPLERKPMRLESFYYPRGLPLPWKIQLTRRLWRIVSWLAQRLRRIITKSSH